MNKAKLLKFAKMLKLMTETNTNNGILIADNELEVGVEVFIQDEEGNLVPANDGEYETDDTIIKVEGGKVVSIDAKEPEEPVTDEPVVEENAEEEPIEEPVEEQTEPDEKDAEIETLKTEIETLKAEIETLKAENEELKKKLEEPAAEPIEDQKDFRMAKEERRHNALETLRKLNQK